ncbi:hypothetical protein AMAG_11576 [Allomyces macrogynus ATCC 38327]|uniref:Uncharacterized protein n=1 Tax=Allomyces macrogynus (strain ATCC 38327) TaxID=578462 RepID=A0A0L0SV35_ALLM3|nr:hypothetical protein AMAG_11576 [Allomyces macrogynus ATCC 38327]|eukprot:KNE66438.1 hypothetical protein AMAG_11576 [Allomyces macrogynus ATCC 38327]
MPTPATGMAPSFTASEDDDNLPILRSRSYSAPSLAPLPPPPIPSARTMPALPERRPSVPPRPQSSFADAIVMARARHRAHSIILPSTAPVPSPAELLRWQRHRQPLVSSGFDSDADDDQSDLSTSTASTSTHGFRKTCGAAKEPTWEPVLTERRLDRSMKALDELLVMPSADVHAILPRFPGYEGASLDHVTPAYGPANPAVEERVHEALFPTRAVDPWIDDDFDEEGLPMSPAPGPVAFASPDVKRTTTLRRRVSVRGRRTAKRRASYALFGAAEVVCQRRTYQWVVEPVVGGEVEVKSVAAQVAGVDAPPRPWEVKLPESPVEGEGLVSVEVPPMAVVMPCHVCAQQGHVACPTLLRMFLVVTATRTRRTATLANTGGARGVPVTSLVTAPALIDVEKLVDLLSSTQGPDVARVRADVEALLDALMAEVRPEVGVEAVVVENVGYRLRAVPVDQVQATRRRWFHADLVVSHLQVGEH